MYDRTITQAFLLGLLLRISSTTRATAVQIRSMLSIINTMNDYHTQAPSFALFLEVFGIIFASFSGLSGALTFTGDVAQPSRSIPRGITIAILFGQCCAAFVLMCVCVGLLTMQGRFLLF
jgi:amino acid transporter